MLSVDFNQFIHFADMAAVFVFAVTGALAAATKKLDILGFTLFAIITGVGGGTARDLILNIDGVFWVLNPDYLAVCIFAAIVTYFTAQLLLSIQRTLLWLDAAGLALFSVIGTQAAISAQVAPLVAITMGMITPTFGSVLRDLLLNKQPVLLGPEIYVTAALLGSSVYLGCHALQVDTNLSIILATTCAFSLRMAAIIWGWQLPKFRQ